VSALSFISGISIVLFHVCIVKCRSSSIVQMSRCLDLEAVLSVVHEAILSQPWMLAFLDGFFEIGPCLRFTYVFLSLLRAVGSVHWQRVLLFSRSTNDSFCVRCWIADQPNGGHRSPQDRKRFPQNSIFPNSHIVR